jgi:murein DD-endopeptidase MepM/ murein hydrolase activator NlpD
MGYRRNRKVRVKTDSSDRARLLLIAGSVAVLTFTAVLLARQNDEFPDTSPAAGMQALARPSAAPADAPRTFERRVAPPVADDPQVQIQNAATGVISRGAEAPTLQSQELWSSDKGVPLIREINHRIQPGESIAKVFDTYGIDAAEAQRWISASRGVYNLNSVFAGQLVTLTIDEQTDEVVGLRVEIDPQTNLVAKREHTQVVAEKETIAFERNLRVVTGRITSSFYAAAAEADVPDKIISQVADILGWDLNFATDIAPGAEFRVVYEELERAEGTRKLPGRVVAVQVDSRRKTHEGIFVRNDDDGRLGYYGRNGESLGKDFLRYPVAFTRISSHFSSGRFHPVLKTRRPHYGVDFAAPTGTPIRAVADGRVDIAGWKGGNGRFIKIIHDEVYDSGYAHLSRIASGIKPGVFVRKGQVIGYVGSSGLATGPHLHFVMYRNGKYINPLSESMPRSKSLGGEALEAFRRQVSTVDKAYAMAEASGERAIVVAQADIK